MGLSKLKEILILEILYSKYMIWDKFQYSKEQINRPNLLTLNLWSRIISPTLKMTGLSSSFLEKMLQPTLTSVWSVIFSVEQ